MRVGVVGIGNMGRAIAERLVEQGHEVAIWNRTPAKAQGIAGTVLCDTPADVVGRADAIISILANDQAIEAVYGGESGLCAPDLSGKLLIEMCTTLPETTRALEKQVTARGGLFLECPVGGSIIPARGGNLLGMAGGTEEAFKVGAPLMNGLCRRLDHLGPVGTGAAMKLAINLPLLVYWGAVGEAVGLAMGEGVDPALALDILGDSSGANAVAKARLPHMLNLINNGETGPASLSLANGLKDMTLMETLARTQGLNSQVVSAARSKAEAAAKGGWADFDTPIYGLYGQATPKA